jgi:hypothetical protein
MPKKPTQYLIRDTDGFPYVFTNVLFAKGGFRRANPDERAAIAAGKYRQKPAPHTLQDLVEDTGTEDTGLVNDAPDTPEADALTAADAPPQEDALLFLLDKTNAELVAHAEENFNVKLPAKASKADLVRRVRELYSVEQD